MNRARVGGVLLTAVLAVVLCAPAWGQQGGELTQGDLQVQHGQVDWTNRTITATGSGAPDLKAPNVAVARLGAERVAKMDALRNILEVLKGVQLDSAITVEKEMVTNSKMRARVQGLIRNFKVLKTKYYSDGGVDLVVQVSLDGPLGSALVKPGGQGANLPASGQAPGSGLIIDARGLKVMPALAPRILDEDGKVVYGADILDQKVLEQKGVLAYYKDLAAARKSSRAGSKPLVVKALRLAEGSHTDVVISNADAVKLRDPNANLQFLAQGRVLLVTN